MSEVQAHHDDDGAHEGPIKTPKQLIWTIFFSFVIPIVVIVLLATFVESHPRPVAGSNQMAATAMAARLRPIGMVEVKDVSDPASMKTGEQVFAGQCSACHTSGAAGAPKLGDTGAWSARVPNGYDALLQSALKGKGAMGPQGGGDFSDFEIGRAVVYMANKGGANFAEPKFAPPSVAGPADAAATQPQALAQAGATVSGAAPAPIAVAAAATPAPVAAATPTATAAPAAIPALYAQVCVACHAAGVAGAPKPGDKNAWAPRIAQGIDALTASVVKGKGAMPPRGGSQASDAEIKGAVTYMVDSAR